MIAKMFIKSTVISARPNWLRSIDKRGNTILCPRVTETGLFSLVPCVCASVRASICGPCEHDRDYTVSCFFVKLGRHVNHDERMNPIDFGGQRSKVKVTMDIYGNKLVNTIETKPLCISLSNLAHMLTMVRWWTLLILEVRGQGHNGHIWK